MGIPIRQNLLHSLLFADDQIIFAQDKHDMEYILGNFKEEYPCSNQIPNKKLLAFESTTNQTGKNIKGISFQEEFKNIVVE